MEITEEMQTAIDAAVEAATKKLNDKNAELRDENKRFKTAATDAETARQEAEDKRQEAADEAARKAGDIATIEANLTAKHDKAMKALEGQLKGANDRLSTLLIDDAITKALVENNVARHMHAPLKAMFKAESSLDAKGVAMHGDQSLADYLPAYFASEDGQAYVTAPVNVGTGATGVTTTNNQFATRPQTQAEFEAFSRFSNTNPAAAEAIAARW